MREEERLSRRAENDDRNEMKSRSWRIKECRGLFHVMLLAMDKQVTNSWKRVGMKNERYFKKRIILKYSRERSIATKKSGGTETMRGGCKVGNWLD